MTSASFTDKTLGKGVSMSSFTRAANVETLILLQRVRRFQVSLEEQKQQHHRVGPLDKIPLI